MTPKQKAALDAAGYVATMGRPRIADDLHGRNIRIPDSQWRQIPEPRSEWVREAITRKLAAQ